MVYGFPAPRTELTNLTLCEDCITWFWENQDLDSFLLTMAALGKEAQFEELP